MIFFFIYFEKSIEWIEFDPSLDQDDAKQLDSKRKTGRNILQREKFREKILISNLN